MYLKRGGKEIMNWRSAEGRGRSEEGRGRMAEGGAQRAKAAQPPTAISAAANRAAAHREAVRAQPPSAILCPCKKFAARVEPRAGSLRSSSDLRWRWRAGGCSRIR